MNFEEWMETVGKAVDAIGVIVIVVGGALAAVSFLRALNHSEVGDAYRSLRISLGRSILLGLEILVAADIIRTVAATPTFEELGVLAAIVLIRTFLSVSLEVELEGRWPWSRVAETSTGAAKMPSGTPSPE